jgi:hypothetical protein
MRVEQYGSVTCEVASNGGFILVRVPVRVMGYAENVKTMFRYHIGGFVGRETTWPTGDAYETTLTFRIPHELFREREHLTLEVLRTGDSAGDETLWVRRYEVHWVNGAPRVEPLLDLSSPLQDEPEARPPGR